MAQISQTELAQRLQRAAAQVPVGARYAHYKHPAQPYRVVGHAIMEADETVGVVYQAEYGERITFVRPLASWMELVPGAAEPVPRFTRLDQ